MLKNIIQLSLVLTWLCVSGCSPEQQTSDPLAYSVLPSDCSSQGLPAINVTGGEAYATAITEEQERASVAVDSHEKGKAHLVLVALHLSRDNPHQDFRAASTELDLAVKEDSALLSTPSVQRWLDVFSRLDVMREVHDKAVQLQEENAALRALLQDKESTITSLVTTLDELKKVEIDVEKKRRLYR